MSNPIESTLSELVTANRILAAEGIVDSFGHISARHPERPDRFVISRVRAAELVTRDDLVELSLDARPVADTEVALFRERFAHAAVYRLRDDVNAVCHHHAAPVLPFCVSGVPLIPVTHLGATMGVQVPFWDARDDFGDTDLLVGNDAQGLSMARAMGPHWTVLLRHHGATVAGRSVKECVFRSIYGARNAQIQREALQLGAARPLTASEAALAESFNLTPFAMDRAWEKWSRALPAGASLPNA